VSASRTFCRRWGEAWLWQVGNKLCCNAEERPPPLCAVLQLNGLCLDGPLLHGTSEFLSQGEDLVGVAHGNPAHIGKHELTAGALQLLNESSGRGEVWPHERHNRWGCSLYWGQSPSEQVVGIRMYDSVPPGTEVSGTSKKGTLFHLYKPIKSIVDFNVSHPSNCI